MKISEIMDLWQRDILTHHFFWKYLEHQNEGLKSGHEVGTLTIVIGPGSLGNNLTKANVMGEQIFFSKDPPLPTFYFTS